MKRLLLIGTVLAAMMGSSAAIARTDFQVLVGGRGSIHNESNYYRSPPPRYMQRPRVIIVPEHIYRPMPKYRSRHRHHDQYSGYRHYQPRQHHYRQHHYRQHHHRHYQAPHMSRGHHGGHHGRPHHRRHR